MNRAVAGLTIALLAGCGEAPSWTEDDILAATTIFFVPPQHYVVEQGDTLAKVAGRHSVAVDDLRAWNGLPGDTIEIGRVLLWWPTPVVEQAVLAVAKPAKKPKKKAGKAAPPVVVAELEVVALPPAPKWVKPADLEKPEPLAQTGVLGALDDDATLADAGVDDNLVDGIGTGSKRRPALGDAGIRGRGDTTFHGAVDRGAGVPTTWDAAAPASTTRAPRIVKPRLSMPAAKRCLAQPTVSSLTSDDGYLSAKGLSVQQIRATTSTFVRHMVSCVPGGEGRVRLEVMVGCDGRVADVSVIDSDGLSGESVSCVADTMYFAPFPAHDWPDGFAFEFPMHFSR